MTVMENNNSPFSPKLTASNAGWLAVVVLGVAAQVYLHVRAGYTLPSPWIDEAHFLWQAAAWARDWSLFAPELNPDRTIMWMPPGYLVVTGFVFKLFGVSLAVARWFSMICLSAAFVFMSLILRQWRWPIVTTAILGLAFLSGPVVACGNIARPEALLLLVGLAGLWLVFTGRSWPGLILLAVGPMVHPNGLMFVASGMAVVLMGRIRSGKWPKLTRSDYLIGGLVLGLWLAYGLHILLNWSGFIADWAYQIERKSGRPMIDSLARPEYIMLMLALLVAALGRWPSGSTARRLLLVAVPLFLIHRWGHEMWYHAYANMSYALFSVFFILALNERLGQPSTRAGHWGKRIGLIAAGGLALAFCYLQSAIPRHDNHPGNLSWYAFRIEHDGIAYLTEDDLEAVEGYLDSLEAADPSATVAVLPRALAFAIPKLASGEVASSCPLFSPSNTDVYLLRTSTYQRPEAFGTLQKEDLAAAGYRSLSEGAVLRERDSWERWYVFETRSGPPGGSSNRR